MDPADAKDTPRAGRNGEPEDGHNGPYHIAFQGRQGNVDDTRSLLGGSGKVEGDPIPLFGQGQPANVDLEPLTVEIVEVCDIGPGAIGNFGEKRSQLGLRRIDNALTPTSPR